MEYVLYTDESIKEGKYYGNFYGGVLVRSNDLLRIEKEMIRNKNELGFKGEVKWQKVTSQYLSKYVDLVDLFFRYIKDDQLKMRVMFTQNTIRPLNLTREQRDNEYTILYYQFLKHAFGFKSCNTSLSDINLRLYFDELPVSPDNAKIFKDYVHRLQHTDDFKDARLKIKKDQITEVASHDHVILQYMDIVLGSIQFRLNDLHKEKPEGSRTRGKRTIAKHELYRHINKKIREIYPNFNIGVSTSADELTRWNLSYGHWLFKSKNHQVIKGNSKNKKINPVSPT